MNIFDVIATNPGVIQNPFYVMCSKCQEVSWWSFTDKVSKFHIQLYDAGWGFSKVHKTWTCNHCLKGPEK